MFNSLQQRLLISAFFLLFIFLGAASFIMDRVAFDSILASEERKLLSYQKALLAKTRDIENDRFGLKRLVSLMDEFNDRESLLFAVVYRENGDIWWQSASSDWVEGIDQFFNEGGRLEEGGRRFGRWRQHFYSNRNISWEAKDTRQLYHFQIVVFEKPDAINAQRTTFRNQMGLGLVIITALLLLVFTLIIVWGLSPLRRLAIDVKRIKQGKTDQLNTVYPKEVMPVIINLNELVTAERQQRERYRHTMSDLAHSLKTPLAVMRTLPEAEQQPIIKEQVDRMDQIIGYQLNRAVVAQSNQQIKAIVIVAVAKRLVVAIEKAYRDKAMLVDFPVDPCCVAIAEGDAMELLGNLIDNAFKYGGDHLRITVGRQQKQIFFVVEDNGVGVDEHHYALILERGQRADTVQHGQGIGLSVVVDILSSYNAGIKVGRSELGGAMFELNFADVST